MRRRALGEDSKDNALTVIFILELHNAKRMKIPDWDVIIKNITIEDVDNNFFDRVENKFYCLAYNCLAELIMCTQTKEENFIKFLFQANKEKK